MPKVLDRLYPEVAAGGFTRVDGTIQFYTRVNALLSMGMTVLDVGAGRGEWITDPVVARRMLRNLRGKVENVIGVDIDPVVQENPAVDRAVVIGDGGLLPFDDQSIDVVISDQTFEHVSNPTGLAAELARVLRRGGWVCARTPNRFGQIAIASSIIPNRLHARALNYLQPNRQARDVFPTFYRLNTHRALARAFPDTLWTRIVYPFDPEPAYAGESRVLWWAQRASQKVLPGAILMIFMRKK